MIPPIPESQRESRDRRSETMAPPLSPRRRSTVDAIFIDAPTFFNIGNGIRDILNDLLRSTSLRSSVRPAEVGMNEMPIILHCPTGEQGLASRLLVVIGPGVKCHEERTLLLAACSVDQHGLHAVINRSRIPNRFHLAGPSLRRIRFPFIRNRRTRNRKTTKN